MADKGIKLTKREIAAAFGDEADGEFPPVLTMEQVSAMLQVPTSTLKQWKTEGRFDGCYRRVGKRVRWFRDRTVEKYFNANQ